MKFEYKTIVFDTGGFIAAGKLDHAEFSRSLSDSGEEGWELVSCVSMTRREGATYEVVAILKRPKSS